MIQLSRRAHPGMVRGKQPLWQRRRGLAWDAFRADFLRRLAADAEYRLLYGDGSVTTLGVLDAMGGTL